MDADHPEPIEKRAWTLQEHLLSVRLLSFGRHITHWSCQEGSECDGSPDLMPLGSQMMWNYRSGIEQYRTVGYELESRYEGNFLLYVQDTWFSLVEEFTKRSMAKSEDRVHALAGLASDLGRFDHGEYLAGVWRSMLPAGLLWTVDPQDRIHNNTRRNTAPTWSWMSVNGRVSFRMEDSRWRPVAKIVETHMVLKLHSAEYGATTPISFLKLSGFLSKARWTGDRTRLKLRDGTRVVASMEDYGDKISAIASDAAPQELEADVDVHLLPLVTNSPKSADPRDVKGFHGLILRRDLLGRYYRLGAFAYEHSEITWEQACRGNMKAQTVTIH